MDEDYPWYTFVEYDEKLSQGDFINECALFHPSDIITPSVENEVEVDGETIIADVIIMTQSCDLDHKKIDLVLVCPIYPMSYFEEQSDFYKSSDAKEALRREYLPGYHLLNKSSIHSLERDFMVLDFRDVYAVHFDYISNLAKKQEKRLRLLPPYREDLSQSFAKFFMRVGLPIEIPKFSKKVRVSEL